MLPYTLPISINGRQYTAELSEYQRRTVPRLREPLDTSPEPGEASLHTEGLWRRSQSLFGGGAGQRFFDDEDSSRERFWISTGVNIWEEGSVTLLPKTTNIFSSTSTDLELLSVRDRLYVRDGNSLYVTSTAEPTSSSDFTQITGTPTTIHNIDTDGEFVYMAGDSDGVYEVEIGTTSASQLSTQAADLVGYARGRLVATNTNEIHEIFAGGGSEKVYSHRRNSFVWRTIESSPIGIYAGGDSGDIAEVYLITVDQDTGSLNIPLPALELPRGETLNALTHYGGIMLLGTSRGIRLARISGGGALVYGPVIEIEEGVSAFSGRGEFAWFTWSKYPDDDDLHPNRTADSTGLGRINLAVFSEPMVPVYTSDLMAPHVEDCVSVTTYNDRQYFAVANQGIFAPDPSGELVESGEIVSGWIRYGTVEDKVVPRLDVTHQSLDGDITSHVHTAIGESLIELEKDTEETSDKVTVFRGPNQEDVDIGERAMVHIDLHRSSSDVTLGPTMNRWTLRAIATPNRLEEVVVPLIISTQVTAEQAGGAPVEIPMDTLAELQYLNGFVGTGVSVDYREGGVTYKAYVDQLSVTPYGWNDDFSYFNGLIKVRLLIREAQN